MHFCETPRTFHLCLSRLFTNRLINQTLLQAYHVKTSIVIRFGEPESSTSSNDNSDKNIRLIHRYKIRPRAGTRANYGPQAVVFDLLKNSIFGP